MEFVAYQYTSPVSGSWEADVAWRDLRVLVRRRRMELGLDDEQPRWPVTRERLEESGAFRLTLETSAHAVETGDARRFLGFVLSEASLTTLLEHVTEEELGLDRLREIVGRTIGSRPARWHLGYQVLLASK
jgi:hypothetical protein